MAHVDFDGFNSRSMHTAGSMPLIQQQHLSATSYSSADSSFRSSNNSTFSQPYTRDSVSSSISGWSHLSRDQYISQAEHLLTENSSFQLSHDSGPPDNRVLPRQRRQITQRRLPVEKDYFKTCVSGNKHTRPCNKDQKYFCTVCKRPFVEKADWKRHEETYQERKEKFHCDLCNAIYFLDKDFAVHHVQSHRCASCHGNIRCSEKRHVRLAKQKRLVRTGWGCGFCCHFSLDWTERCNHIADHIEKEDKTIGDWYHSWVIYSLLQRPAIWAQWTKLLQQYGVVANLAWNEHSTGRVEGYPESVPNLQLQDALEYFTPDANAAALAQLAFDKAIKRTAEVEVSVPPPVPPKDIHRDPLTELTLGADSWAMLGNTILKDDFLPTNISYLEQWHAG